MSELTSETYWAKMDALKAKYKDFCTAKDVECLNLIMRREFAEQILKGEKKVEIRAVSQHYLDRLVDKKVADFKGRHENDMDVQDLCDPIRLVKKIHFHNYNNSWYLDVAVEMNDFVAADEEGVKFLHDRYNCNELDEVYNSLGNLGDNAPCFFYFALGDVLGTNL